MKCVCIGLMWFTKVSYSSIISGFTRVLQWFCSLGPWLWSLGFSVTSFGGVCRSNIRSLGLLKGSWDLVTRVIIKVTILIIAYNPN